MVVLPLLKGAAAVPTVPNDVFENYHSVGVFWTSRELRVTQQPVTEVTDPDVEVFVGGLCSYYTNILRAEKNRLL